MNAYIIDIYTNVTKGVYQIEDEDKFSCTLSVTNDVTNNVTLYYQLGFKLDTISTFDIIYIPKYNIIGVVDSVVQNNNSDKKIDVNYRLGFQLNVSSQYTLTRGILEEGFIDNVIEDWQNAMSWLAQITEQTIAMIDNSDRAGGYLFFSNDGAIEYQPTVYRNILRQGFKIDYVMESGINMIFTKPERKFWGIRLEDTIDYTFRLDTSQPNALTLRNTNGFSDITVSLKQDGSITENMVYEGNNQSVKPYILQTELDDTPTLNEAIAKLKDITYQNAVEITVRHDWVYLKEAFELYKVNIFNLCGDGVIIKLDNGRELISIVDEITFTKNHYVIKLGQSKNRIF